MPYEKLKNESYAQFGGINSKSSPYATSPLEFLDIINWDFQTPGSLSQRWGSTQYVSQNFTLPIQSLTEFSRLDGSSYVIVGTTGALWSGATTGQSQGLSLNTTGSTLFQQVINGDWGFIPDFATIFHPSLTGDGINGLGYYGATQFVLINGSSIKIAAEPNSNNKMSFATLNNFLFMADGTKFLKSDGASTYYVGLPPPNLGDYTTSGTHVMNNLSNGTFPAGFGATGFYVTWISYVNNRGFESQVWPIFTIAGTSFRGTTAVAVGGTYIVLGLPVQTPLGFGISSINVYNYFQTASVSLPSPNLWNLGGVFQSNRAASGSSYTVVFFGTSTGGQTNLINNNGALINDKQYLPSFGFTLSNANSAALGYYNPLIVSDVLQLPTFPQYLETYVNRMFCAGFSNMPSTVWFSDAGEPEGYLADSNFEVRTNDADVITAIKTYGSALYIFKNKSFHVLNGDNPNNFFLSQISDQYGCVNNRSVITYESSMAFLDKKGVIYYNGANLQHLSLKVQSVFDSVNSIAAQDQACMVHDKLRNQILVGLPVNGATLNNITMVYDYVLNAWTKQDGYKPTVFTSIQGRNNTKNVFYGTSSGLVNWFGPSFLSDNGTGFSCYFKTRFLHDMGESYQKQFRRLYLNIDAPSATIGFHVNFFQDYGSSVVKSVTVNMSQFQTRIDYGISAKALAFELSALQTSVPLRLHGFTIESRLQRRV